MSSDFWRGKVVLISGASSGIGLALARHCHARGGRVGLMARRGELLRSVCEELSGLAESYPDGASGAVSTDDPARQERTCAWQVADVRSGESTRQAIKSLERTLGPCDVIVANAGVYRRTRATTWDDSAAADVLSVNVQGVVNTIGAVLPGMVERDRGSIVAVSSLMAWLAYPGAGTYAGSKMAVIRMLDGLRVDLRSTRLRVTTICPGYVDTPMITDRERRELRGLVSAPEAARRIAQGIEKGRPMVCFPRSTYWLIRWANLLPRRVQDAILSRQPELE